MKKLLLTTALVALSCPALAAGYWEESKRSGPDNANVVVVPKGQAPSDFQVVERELKGNTLLETRTTVRFKEPEKDEFGNYDYSGRYTLVDGSHLLIDGTSIYLVDADGDKYYAPKGAYTTRDGMTFFAESGEVLRMEHPADIMYVDIDRDDKAS
ncbi:MAG: hypothetical protein IT558_05565 [Alphaproteobacteria bacterium]|nr:hypothetical protein [Alphaproteobacteria bacterium]